MKIGERLAEARKDCGLKQKDVGKMMHLADSTISNYETNTHLPDLDKLNAMADIYGVSTDYILGRTNIPQNMNALKVKIHDTITKEDVLNFMEHLSKEDCVYLVKTLRLLYNNSMEKKKIRSKK